MKKITMTGNANSLTAAHDGHLIAFDCDNGNMEVLLPPSATLPEPSPTVDCWSIPYMAKVDPGAGIVRFRPQGDDRLNHFWTSGEWKTLCFNLTQQAGELVYLGEGNFHIAAKPFHRSLPQSQRTITAPSFQITHDDSDEKLDCYPPSGGQGIYFAPKETFCPLSPVTNGNYQSQVYEVHNVHPSEPVTVFAASGDAMNGVVGGSVPVPPLTSRRFYVASNGVWSLGN